MLFKCGQKTFCWVSVPCSSVNTLNLNPCQVVGHRAFNVSAIIAVKTIDCRADTTLKTFRDSNMTRTDRNSGHLSRLLYAVQFLFLIIAVCAPKLTQISTLKFTVFSLVPHKSLNTSPKFSKNPQISKNILKISHNFKLI